MGHYIKYKDRSLFYIKKIVIGSIVIIFDI